MEIDVAAIFELDQIKDLPFWAQVLIASRMARRAALWLPANVPQATRDSLVAACDALDRFAQAGTRTSEDTTTIKNADAIPDNAIIHAAAETLRWASDAAMAAHDTQDFGAADAACINSAKQAMNWAMQSPGLNPLQVRVFAAADLDTLRFACKESRVGRYDPLGKDVMGRIAPVYPPNEPTPAMTRPRGVADAEDPTRGAR